jgi:hypothetical protein
MLHDAQCHEQRKPLDMGRRNGNTSVIGFPQPLWQYYEFTREEDPDGVKDLTPMWCPCR